MSNIGTMAVDVEITHNLFDLLQRAAWQNGIWHISATKQKCMIECILHTQKLHRWNLYEDHTVDESIDDGLRVSAVVIGKLRQL